MEAKDYLTKTHSQIIKQRMKEGKKRLSALRSDDKQYFIAFVIKQEPVYDSAIGGVKITNAWNGKTADLRVTELMKEYIEQVENNLKKQ